MQPLLHTEASRGTAYTSTSQTCFAGQPISQTCFAGQPTLHTCFAGQPTSLMLLRKSVDICRKGIFGTIFILTDVSYGTAFFYFFP